VLFEDKRHDALAPFWQEVLDLEAPQPGYRIVTAEHAFCYHIGPVPAAVTLDAAFQGYGYHYDDSAQPKGRLHGSRLALALGRREYALLYRDHHAWPWQI
jgi:hypothetical protein